MTVKKKDVLSAAIYTFVQHKLDEIGQTLKYLGSSEQGYAEYIGGLPGGHGGGLKLSQRTAGALGAT